LLTMAPFFGQTLAIFGLAGHFNNWTIAALTIHGCWRTTSTWCFLFHDGVPASLSDGYLSSLAALSSFTP